MLKEGGNYNQRESVQNRRDAVNTRNLDSIPCQAESRCGDAGR